jgi:hypothetical protein
VELGNYLIKRVVRELQVGGGVVEVCFKVLQEKREQSKIWKINPQKETFPRTFTTEPPAAIGDTTP